MSDYENPNPIQGDAVVKHFGPLLGGMIAGSERASELLIAPLVEASTVDFDSLDPEVREELLALRRMADESWAEYHQLIKKQRLADDLTEEEWDERGVRNLLKGMQTAFEAAGREPDDDW